MSKANINIRGDNLEDIFGENLREKLQKEKVVLSREWCFFFARWLKLKFHVTSFSWSLTCSRHSTWTFCLLFFWSFVLNLNTIKIKREFFELKIGLILLINFSFIEVSSKSLMSWFFCFLIFGILGRGVWSIKPCPSRCICERGTVDCSGLGLTEVPPNIPRTTQSLWVYKKTAPGT